MPAINFLWDPRPGSNIDHIAAHGMTTQQWESVFHNADRREEDKDEPSFVVAEGRLKKRLFRIVYELDGDVVVPITIIPITGFPITRRALQRNKP